MLTVGLTGPSGAGKGTVASLFARYGVPSIDTDAVYHALLTPPSACLDELTARFGREILTAKGTLDRQALAAVVFAPGHAADLADLNKITHRHVLCEVRRLLAIYKAEGKSAVLVDAPQLFESGFDTECDFVLAVLASREARMSRIMARDGLDVAQATARLDAQKSDDFFREQSDAILVNDSTAEDMDAEIRRMLTLWEVPYEA
ncbi:MAG: dephospho-CoA kinase [Clostridia bacterium]|nr:dephospho-CoA kinase [Clostridia bacterium]